MSESTPPKGPRAPLTGNKTPIDPGMIARAAGTIKGWLGMGASAQRQLDAAPPMANDPETTTERPVAPSQVMAPTQVPGSVSDGFMGPGVAIGPVVDRFAIGGARAFDFRPGFNLTTQPRNAEGTSFAMLRALADNYDLLRLVIETRKDQVTNVGWSILPIKPPGQSYPPKADEHCKTIEDFFKRPDGVNRWPEWIRILVEDSLVLDAVGLYRRRTLDGKPYALEVIAGETINLLIDKTGRRPLPPQPAFTQVLKGLPAAQFTSEELTYAVRNPRSHRAYGLGPVEQIITYVNIGLRRMAGQLQHYTEGNIPDALMGVPETWTTQQISEWQVYWDLITSDQAVRRKMKFVPGGMNYQQTRPDGALTDPFDEWLARICCYCFSLPPLPFVKQQNRATADTALETALEEGLLPLLKWIKGVVDAEIKEFMGKPGYELVWDDVRKVDPAEQQGMDLQDARMGIKSIDDIRAARGQEPLGLPPLIFGVGPMGFMSVDDMKRCIEQGLTMPPAPGAAPEIGPDGQPLQGDPLANADPALMGMLGGPEEGANTPMEGEGVDEPFNEGDEGDDGEDEQLEEMPPPPPMRPRVDPRVMAGLRHYASPQNPRAAPPKPGARP